MDERDWLILSTLHKEKSITKAGQSLFIAQPTLTKRLKQIENEFEVSRLASLGQEQLHFIEIFLKCRGNIKEVEKELGISYPTVRGKLDEIISTLGYSTQKKPEIDKSKIVTLLEKGEITAEKAIQLLKEGDL